MSEVVEAAKTVPEENPAPVIGVYRLNKFEVWAAHTLDEALKAAAAYSSMPAAEIIDELCPPRQLGEAELHEVRSFAGGEIEASYQQLLDANLRLGNPIPTILSWS